MANETPAGARPDRVLLSHAVVEALDDLPKSQARAVARAIERIRRGDSGQQLKFSVPGADEGSYYAMRTSNLDAPVLIYRPLSDDEGGGFLVTALVDRGDFRAYERADQKGLLDKPLGKVMLGAAAAAAALGARAASRR